MRLDFNVLWIDDQPANVTSFQFPLQLKTEAEGFKLKVVQAKSLLEAMEHLANDVFLDNIDLVVVDYNLGVGEWGDVAVQKIRHRVPYKDIIFYSAIETTDLKQKMLAANVEGVFCSHREDLPSTLIGVFESLVKKVLDIDHCRGIVMGATSDIDHIVNECLLALELVLDAPHKDTASSYVLKNLDNRLKSFQKVRDQLANGMPMSDILKSTEAVPAADRLRLLKKILSLHFPEDHIAIRRAVDEYIVKVPQRRNDLGHVRLVARGGTRNLVGPDFKTVTADDLKELRQMLIAYQDRFEELATILGVSSDEATDSSSTPPT